MKRNILWIVAACLLCLGFTSCQEPDAPSPLVPVLQLNEAQDVTATTAYVGNYSYDSDSSIGEFYYLFSTNENFQDSLVYSAKLNSFTTIYGLRPNTTYFYKLVGTDGSIKVNSEVRSFTTLKGFSIAKLTYTDWDGEVKEVDESMSPLGLSVVDTDGWSTRNLMVTYQNGEWRVPDEILGKDIKECGIYTPYKKESDYMNEDALGWLRLCTYKNGKNSVDDVLTGYAYLKEDKSVSLRLSHALARVRFHFTIAEDCNEDNLEVQSFIIVQEASSKIIPSIFFYSLYGKITSVGEFMNIDSGESFVMTKKSQSDVTILSGATRSSGTVQAKIQLSNGSTYSVPITLKADSWKRGNTYDYNIVYSRTGLTLSDVTVKEWNKNESGDINIYE